MINGMPLLVSQWRVAQSPGMRLLKMVIGSQFGGQQHTQGSHQTAITEQDSVCTCGFCQAKQCLRCAISSSAFRPHMELYL